MNRKKLLKIIIPVCIIIVIAGIGVMKNYDKIFGKQAERNEDVFSLEASVIDLEKLKLFDLPIIIDFGENCCVSCKQMIPILETLNAEMRDKAIIKYVDASENDEAAQNFSIKLLPAQIFINADGTAYVPDEDIGITVTIHDDLEVGEHAYAIHHGTLTEEELRLILADMGVKE